MKASKSRSWPWVSNKILQLTPTPLCVTLLGTHRCRHCPFWTLRNTDWESLCLPWWLDYLTVTSQPLTYFKFHTHNVPEIIANGGYKLVTNRSSHRSGSRCTQHSLMSARDVTAVVSCFLNPSYTGLPAWEKSTRTFTNNVLASLIKGK